MLVPWSHFTRKLPLWNVKCTSSFLLQKVKSSRIIQEKVNSLGQIAVHQTCIEKVKKRLDFCRLWNDLVEDYFLILETSCWWKKSSPRKNFGCSKGSSHDSLLKHNIGNVEAELFGIVHLTGKWTYFPGLIVIAHISIRLYCSMGRAETLTPEPINMRNLQASCEHSLSSVLNYSPTEMFFDPNAKLSFPSPAKNVAASSLKFGIFN